MTRLRGSTFLIVCAFLAWAGPAHADTVTDWNAITIDAAGTGRPGPISFLDIALVQAAVHDAVQAIDGRFEPYKVEVPGADGSREAAAAAAAYYVLVGFYPEQAGTLTPTYNDYLAAHGLVGDPGLAVGQQVAAAFIPLRRNPPSPLPGDNASTDPGRWRPTDSFLQGSGPGVGLPGPPFGPPPPFAAGAVPWLGTTQPFTFDNPQKFRDRPPPALWSSRYRREYNEIRTLGARLDTTVTEVKRTDAQTDLAYFYADNFIALWYRALRAIADEHLHRIGDSARLFALASLAGADAVITAWDSKYHFNFWRPLTAVREGDNDLNRRTVGDPDWEPLLNTPNYADHTSGANCLTGSMTRTLRLFFRRDKFTFKVTSNFPLAILKEREYKRFSDMAQDVVDVRIYQGIHFRTADEVGRRQGQRVARWVFKKFLRPLDHCDDDDDHGRRGHCDDDDDDDDDDGGDH
jgi:hypothetical protein